MSELERPHEGKSGNLAPEPTAQALRRCFIWNLSEGQQIRKPLYRQKRTWVVRELANGIANEPRGTARYWASQDKKVRPKYRTSLRGVNLDQDLGYTTLGLRAATTTRWGNTQVTPHFSAAWQHAFDDVTPGASLAFATTGIGFGIDGVPLAEDAALIDAGLDFALGENGTAGVSYSGQFGDGVTDNAVKGRVTWLF